MNLVQIGIPRALLYYRYGSLWESFLKALGVEIVLSPKTDEAVLERGLVCVSSEVCLPIKIIAGHLLYLRDCVDAIFFPRLDYLYDGLYACPKMIGIVDVARMILGKKVRLVAPKIRGNFDRAHFVAGLQICSNPVRVWQAWQRSKRNWLSALKRDSDGIGRGELKSKQVGLIGHFYNIGDRFISEPVIRTFEQSGYSLITKEDLPSSVLLKPQGFARNIRWVYERELYNAFEFLLDKVAGFCVIVSMGCGPDSVVVEFMRDRARVSGVPLLVLVIDEHTGYAGLVTRVEAFVELLRRGDKTGE